MSCKVSMRAGFPQKKIGVGSSTAGKQPVFLQHLEKTVCSPGCRNQSVTGAQLKGSNCIL